MKLTNEQLDEHAQHRENIIVELRDKCIKAGLAVTDMENKFQGLLRLLEIEREKSRSVAAEYARVVAQRDRLAAACLAGAQWLDESCPLDIAIEMNAAAMNVAVKGVNP